MYQSELDWIRKQLNMKEEGVRELKVVNDTYKTKC